MVVLVPKVFLVPEEALDMVGWAASLPLITCDSCDELFHVACSRHQLFLHALYPW